MATLILLRHAKSSWKDSTLNDFDRPLNSKGCNDAKKIGKRLLDRDIIPDVIVSSSSIRTKQTIEMANGDYIIESLDPKLLSTIITTEIGKWTQVKIAGESIQRRLSNENIMAVMKSYNYPDETDYIILGEIYVLANKFEIDIHPEVNIIG